MSQSTRALEGYSAATHLHLWRPRPQPSGVITSSVRNTSDGLEALSMSGWCRLPFGLDLKSKFPPRLTLELTAEQAAALGALDRWADRASLVGVGAWSPVVRTSKRYPPTVALKLALEGEHLTSFRVLSAEGEVLASGQGLRFLQEEAGEDLLWRNWEARVVLTPRCVWLMGARRGLQLMALEVDVRLRS